MQDMDVVCMEHIVLVMVAVMLERFQADFYILFAVLCFFFVCNC